MLSSDDILKTSQLITILLWIIPNLQVQCDDTSSELLPSYSLPNSILTILGSSKEEKRSDIFIHFKDEPLSTETLFSSSVNLFTSFTQTQPESVSQQSSYFHSSPSIIFSQNNLQTNDPSISVVSSLVEAFISISMFNSLANIEDTNNSSTTQISKTEFISDDDNPIPDILSSYLQPLDEFFSMPNSLLPNSTGQILKSISVQQNLNDSIVLESFPVAKSKPPTKEQDINESKFDKLIYTSFTVVDSVNINNKLLDINSMYIRSFNQQSHIQLNSESQMDEIISESKIFLPMFTVKSLKSYISPSFHTKGKLLSDMHTVSHFNFTGKTYFRHRNIDPLSTLNDFTPKESTFSSTKTENLYRSLTVNFIKPMQSDESKTESILPYQYEVPTYQTKLFTLQPSETQIPQIDEMESLYSINKNQMFLYSDPFLESHQSAISQSYSTSIKHSNKSDESLSDLKSSFWGDILSLVNDQTSSIFIKSNTKSHYSLQSNFLQKSKFIKPTMSQLISAYLDESQIIFDSNKLLYMSTSVIAQTPQEQTERKSSFVNSDFNFKKSFQTNLYQSILSLTQFNDKQSSLSTFTELLKSETSDIFNEHLKSKLESTKMKSSGTNLGYNSDDLSSPSLRGRNTVYILKPTQSLLQYLLQSLSTESGSIDVLGGEESSPLSNIEILDPSETVSLTNLEDFLLLTSQNIFQSIVSLGITNTDNLITSSSSEELFYLLNSVLSFSTEPSHSKELSQPYTYTYIPTTELLSEQSIASSQIKMLSSPQESVSPVLMKSFSSPNMNISSNSEHIFETSSEDLYSSVTTTETNVFSEGHERYVFGTLDPENVNASISTSFYSSNSMNSVYDSSMINVAVTESVYDSSMTNAAVTNSVYDSSMINAADTNSVYDSSMTNIAVSNSVYDSSMTNVAVTNSVYDSSMTNAAVTKSVYDSSMINAADTNSVYDSSMTNIAVSNSVYDSSMINVAVSKPVYDSSMINVAVTDYVYDSSMINVAVTESVYDSSMINAAVTNSVYDSSMINAAITKLVYDSSMTNAAVTNSVYDSSMTNIAVSNSVYDSSMINVAVSKPVYDSSMINVAVTDSVYDSSMINAAVTNSVYDSSMINAAVTNSVTLNAMSSTLHPNTDVELGSTHLTPGSIYLYTSQTPIFVSSSFINENNSNPNTTSNMSDSNLFSASNLTLPSNQMVIPTEITTLSNYTLASININISVTHSAFNNNNSEPKNISDSSSMQKTEFYIASSSVSEIFSQELQLNNSIYFQHFWIVTIIKVRNDIDINSFEFKQDMENRLARSYVEAYKRGEHIMNGTYHPLRKKRFAFVKGIALQIMKITHPNHGLSNNVSLVYYMEKNGRPVPVNDAIKHMNLIQLQELAIYLNQVVVLRAESYLKAPHGKYSDNWIIGVVLGSVAVVLLFMWCVLFIFFKCFRRPPLKIQEEKVINIQKIRCNSELLTEDKISKKEKRRSLEERDRLKNQNDDEKHFVNVSQDYVKISLEEMSKPKNTKKGSNKKPCKTITEEQEAPVKNKRQKARLVQSVGYVSSPTKDYDQKSLRFGIFDQNPEESKNNEDISSSCYVNLPPIQSHVSLVATKPKFVKDCYKRRKILQEELQMKQDLSSNELYINVNAECEDTGCSDCGLTNSPNYTRKNNRKVSKQRKCNLKHASDMNTFKESSLNEMYDDHKLWQRQPDTLQRTCVKMHNLLDDAFQLISMNLPQLNVKNISAVDQSNYPRRNVNEKQRHQHHSKSIAEQVLTNRKPFLSESLNEQSHEMQHIPKYSQYQQHCECTPQLGYSRHNNVSPSWHKVGDELNKISSDTQAWIPFMSPNKDCFNHITKHSPKTLMCSTQHFPDNHKENNLIPSMNNFCCSTPPSSNYYVPQLSSPSSYPATKFHLCPHRQVATSLDISSNQLRTVGSKIPNLSSSTKNSNKIGTFQQFPRFPSQTSNSNQSSQQMSQKATDDEIDAIYKNIKPNSPQPLIQSIREELMTTSAYNNEINSFNILE